MFWSFGHNRHSAKVNIAENGRRLLSEHPILNAPHDSRSASIIRAMMSFQFCKGDSALWTDVAVSDEKFVFFDYI